MNAKILAIASVVALTAMAIPATAHANGVETQTIRYIMSAGYYRDGGGLSTSIWCAAGGHSYAPIGNWDGDTGTLEGWLFSGEPECLAGDVATGNGESALGGGAFRVQAHLGDSFALTATDDLTANNVPLRISIAAQGTTATPVSQRSCGIGVLSGAIPTDVPDHYQLTVPRLKLAWAFVNTVGVDTTTTAVCAAGQGNLVMVL